MEFLDKIVFHLNLFILNINDDFCEKSRKDVESELGYYLDHISNNRELVNYVANISLI